VFDCYFFEKNLQGDIVAIYNEAGSKIGTYTYDAWGNCTVNPTSGYNFILSNNPFRYRGYYYDTETGYYYLQSRYYNPNWCRFINADKYVSTGQGFTGYNMFAYCLNNPVNWIDIYGEKPTFLQEILNQFTEWVMTPLGLLRYVYIINRGGFKSEYWVDSDGYAQWSRHHTNHGHPKGHPVVPHDHKWYDDDDGNHKEDSKWQNPDQRFQPPKSVQQTPNNESDDNKTNFYGEANKMVVGTVGTVAVGYLFYVGVKWIIATAMVPATCGGSLIIAGVTP